ncbi:MAG: hypothetical protein R2771_05720 [Saprospiraceae bacterium]
MLYRYEQHVMPSYEKYIEPFSLETDIMSNNNHDFDTAISIFKVSENIPQKTKILRQKLNFLYTFVFS